MKSSFRSQHEKNPSNLISCKFGCLRRKGAEALPLSLSLSVFFFLGSLRSDHGCNIWCLNLASPLFTKQQTNNNTIGQLNNKPTTTKLTWRPKKRKQGHWLHALCIKVCLAYERTPTRATVVKHCRRPNCLNGDILPSIIQLWSGNPSHCLENPNWILLTLKLFFLLECRKYKRKWKILYQTCFLELYVIDFD